MSFFKTLVRRWFGKRQVVTPSNAGLLDPMGYDRLERGVRRFHLCPDAPDFQALARAVANARDRTTGQELLMEMLALVQRELVIARETGYALGATHREEKREKERHDADPGLPTRATWWS